MAERSLAVGATVGADTQAEKPAAPTVPAAMPVTSAADEAAPRDPAAPITPVKLPTAVAVKVEEPDSDPLLDEPSWSDWFQHAPSWMASTVLHLSLVLLLALLTTIRILPEPAPDFSVSAEGSDGLESGTDDLSGDGGDAMETVEGLEAPSDTAAAPAALADLPPDAALAEAIAPASILLPGKADFQGVAVGLPTGSPSGIGLGDGDGDGIGKGIGESLLARLDGGKRGNLLRASGGTPQSEYAVSLALKWLAEHQNTSDGSWSFEHQKSPRCHGQCENPGFTPGNVAATALALLPFLGTGQTHREGEYRKTIDAGLQFLIRSMQLQSDLGSLNESGGMMYGHGLASIALCEAYGMTRDEKLRFAAQACINYIIAAQDPHGGGWRYMYQQPGDTSVVGWQLMALKSAQLAYMKIPPTTLQKADYFLTHVQSDKGATYGYQGPEGRRPATTAIGLLCRMYLGWKHDNSALQRGVQILGQLGPSTDKTGMRNNMYYNYYATQVMHHYGGYPWKRWNDVMRDYLVSTQSRKGHEEGSWFFVGADHGSSAGGRLYCTAMAAMTLEVYYRYMPLYRDQSVLSE